MTDVRYELGAIREEIARLSGQVERLLQGGTDTANTLNMLTVQANALNNGQIGAANALNGLEVALHGVTHTLAYLRETAEASSRLAWLERRGAAAMRARLLTGARDEGPSVVAPAAADWNAQMAELRRRAPRNFDAWLHCFEAGRREYEKRLPDSLSTAAHAYAADFGTFIQIHGRGRMLDLGVGPLAKPTYLDGVTDDKLGAIDPLPPYEPHPFAFSLSAAEFLPWPDRSFDTVISATSIDHVYLLDVTFDEIKRVLTPGGRFLVWTGVFENTRPYEPYSAAMDPLDAYHLFHPGENWFPQLLEQHFRLIERFDIASVGYSNSFLAYEVG